MGGGAHGHSRDAVLLRLAHAGPTDPGNSGEIPRPHHQRGRQHLPRRDKYPQMARWRQRGRVVLRLGPARRAIVRPGDLSAGWRDCAYSCGLPADHRQALEAVGNGLLGLRKAPVGKANPQLVAAYGAALAPYLPAIAGSDGSPGFPPFQHSTPEDFARARNIFAVIATNTEAGREFVERASEDAERIAATADHDACEPESAKHNVDSAVLRTAGILAGLADSMSNEGSSPERHQILDDISYTMAAACVSADPTPPTSQIAGYMESGRLLTPDEVLQQRDEGLEDYYQSLRDYLAIRDIEIEPYLAWYEKARG